MKKLLPLLAMPFFMFPSVSLAAGLTSQQATSLIAIVQSFPGAPASAFVSLITSFSNVTVNQATSLIAVVQAAPGVPASAFVNLLTSFTADTSTAPVTPVTTPVQISENNGAQLSLSLGQVSVTTNSIYISWTTNVPATSKVFLTKVSSGISAPDTQVIASSAGVSTQGFVNIPNLSTNTQYAYTIEAINGAQDQKIFGVIQTAVVPPTFPSADPQVATMSQDLPKLAKSFVAGTCPSSPIIVVQPQLSAGQSIATIVGDTITWNSSTGQENMGFYIYDPCVSPNDLTWSYSSSMVSVNGSSNGIVSTVSSQPGMSWNLGSTSSYFSNGEGVAEAAFLFNSTSPQVVTITATEPGGGQTTKTITNILAQ